jgi:hypothetical protein
VQIAGQDAQNGRLTRPVRAEQPEHIAGAGFERDVVHPDPATVTLGEMLGDDDRRHEEGTSSAGHRCPGAQVVRT